ncbi:MAG TPA: RNA polymerase sigma factor RpoH [Rhodospirillales bacterium]|nr:RNA polymerase sigma factor RpoH [Rhodospirillales bacterium]
MTDEIATHSMSFSPEGNLSRYMRRIRTFPLLSVEEEQDLARRLISQSDRAAADTLVNSHLRLAAKIAMGYRGYGLAVEELISEANVGLMQAVHRFDPERGFRLATYAMWWIRAAIQEYILQSWSLVRLGTTAQQKKLFFNLRRLKGELRAFEEGDLSPENVDTIAERLSVPATDVINMNRRLGGPDQSLNAPLREQGEGEWLEWLVDGGESQEIELGTREERSFRRGLLSRAMRGLSQRERDIVIERRLTENPLTLERLAKRYGISRERVRQIEAGAVAKLARSVRESDRLAKAAGVRRGQKRFGREPAHAA